MRTLKQPGPIEPIRVSSFEDELIKIEIDLHPGDVLIDAISKGLKKFGITAAGIQFRDLYLKPMNYVKPTFSKTSQHVAYYSDTYLNEKETHIYYATSTYGLRDDKPFMHCHALWNEKGITCGGHVLCPDSIISKSSKALVCGSKNVVLDSVFDKETNFTLFKPYLKEISNNQLKKKCIIATIKPNVDLVDTIEEICKSYNIKNAKIFSGIGSTIGANFTNGICVTDVPTEIVVLNSNIKADDEGKYDICFDVALIDAVGNVHVGKLEKGNNPVLICFELIIEEV